MSEEVKRLPVRAVRVTKSSGESDCKHTVQCPRKHQSTAFEHCCGCAHMRSIDIDESGARHTILCGVDGDDMPHGRVDVAEAAVRARLGDLLPAETNCVEANVPITAVADDVLAGDIDDVAVVDEGRQLVGVVRKSAILRARHDRKRRPTTVRDLMTPLEEGLADDAPVAHAISRMAFEKIDALPIVDARGQVVGMLTANHVLRWVASALGYIAPSEPARGETECDAPREASPIRKRTSRG